MDCFWTTLTAKNIPDARQELSKHVEKIEIAPDLNSRIFVKPSFLAEIPELDVICSNSIQSLADKEFVDNRVNC